MTDVLFGQSYYLRFDPKLWQAMQPYPPLGTLLAAAVAREAGYAVEFFDAMLSPGEDEWAAQIEKTSPRYAVLFEDNFNYLSKMCLSRMREASFRMLRAAKARGSVAIVCGSDASDHSQDYLAAGADYVLIGEGEETLMELLSALDLGESTEQIQGLVYLHKGALMRTPARRVMRNLDDLPPPAWDLIDLQPYRELWQQRHGYYSLNLVTTRGCPYHCNWCAKPIWGQTYNMRSPERVAAEVAAVHESYRPDHIWFADDIFGLKKGWIDKFADALEEHSTRVPYKCLSRVDLLLRGGEIEALGRSGCDIVWVGAESGSQSVLDAMEKGTKVEQIEEASRRLREGNVKVGFFLQFGYPGETKQDIDKTLQLVESCQPDEIGMSVSYPLPGTPFYERVKSQLGDKKNWVDSADLDVMYEGPYSNEFYRQVVRYTQKRYRLTRTRREIAAAITRPSGLRPRHAYRVGVLGYHALTLPFERARMNRLAVPSGDAAPSLIPDLTHGEAATPSPQSGSLQSGSTQHAGSRAPEKRTTDKRAGNDG